VPNINAAIAAGKIDRRQLYHPALLPTHGLFIFSAPFAKADGDFVYVGSSLSLGAGGKDDKIIVAISRDLFWNHARIIGYANGFCETVSAREFENILEENNAERRKSHFRLLGPSDIP